MIDDDSGCVFGLVAGVLVLVACYFAAQSGCSPPKGSLAAVFAEEGEASKQQPPSPLIGPVAAFAVAGYVVGVLVALIVLLESKSPAALPRALLWPLVVAVAVVREVPRILRGR